MLPSRLRRRLQSTDGMFNPFLNSLFHITTFVKDFAATNLVEKILTWNLQTNNVLCEIVLH